MLPKNHPAVTAELMRKMELRRRADDAAARNKDKDKAADHNDDEFTDRDTGKWRQQHMDLAEKRALALWRSGRK